MFRSRRLATSGMVLSTSQFVNGCNDSIFHPASLAEDAIIWIQTNQIVSAILFPLAAPAFGHRELSNVRSLLTKDFFRVS